MLKLLEEISTSVSVEIPTPKEKESESRQRLINPFDKIIKIELMKSMAASPLSLFLNWKEARTMPSSCRSPHSKSLFCKLIKLN